MSSKSVVARFIITILSKSTRIEPFTVNSEPQRSYSISLINNTP